MKKKETSAGKAELEKYYKTCPFPKPRDKKTVKKSNGWKDKAKRVCYYCGTTAAERHEVFPGNPNRQISLEHGFQVDLCQNCHREMQDNITEQANERNRYWRQYYQKEYENKLIDSGVDPEQAREIWIGLIGRSYL